MKDFNKKIIIFSALVFGLAGWVSWLYIFWYILLNPNPKGYYLNPFIFHEFWIEFIFINFIVFGFIILIRFQWSDF